ncbi:MAG: thiamine biosynthesis protein ThiS [Bacteroidia bacterium]|nr:MAG: thiamine biosynthesis protein ThiS [Bacteroidia bacterium]
MKQVYVNDKIQEIENNATVADLLKTHAIKTEGVAVAINNKVVRQKDWAVTIPEENDKLLIINASQGG